MWNWPKKISKQPHSENNRRRYRVACWQEKGYQKLQYLQRKTALIMVRFCRYHQHVSAQSQTFSKSGHWPNEMQIVNTDSAHNFFSQRFLFNHRKKANNSAQYQYPQTITSVEPLVQKTQAWLFFQAVTVVIV